MTIPIFHNAVWHRIAKEWVAYVGCDVERDRDAPGLLGKVEIDGEVFECTGVERFMPRRPISAGEIIGLAVREVKDGE